MSPSRLLNFVLSLRDEGLSPQEEIHERFNDTRDDEDWSAAKISSMIQ
jgi:hypothetical protein